MTGLGYAELHAHTHHSLLDGVDTPAEMVAEAVRLGLSALGVCDHDSLAAIPAMAAAAREHGLRTVFGAELSLTGTGRTGAADPPGRHLLVLANSPAGYRKLSRAISRAHLAGGAKGRVVYDLDELANDANGSWEILTGCRKGHVPAALAEAGTEAGEAALKDLVDRFGREHVHVELVRGGAPGEELRCRELAELAARHHLPVLATGNVHYARPSGHRVHAALAAIRARRTLEEIESWVPAGPSAFLRAPEEAIMLHAAHPGAIEHSLELAEACALDYDTQLRPDPPRYPVPDGYTEDSYLRELTEAGMLERYGTREQRPDAWAKSDFELGVVARLGFAGFFLIAWSVADYCRRNHILAQGRGSAANSVIIYALGVSACDPVRYGLLFERFLHEARQSPPDVDVDVQASRREELITWIYDRFGRESAAMVSNEVTLQPRFALREAARVLGYPTGVQDAISGALAEHRSLPDEHPEVPAPVLDLARGLHAGGERVRHYGIHSGGMIMCSGELASVLPIEWATMPGRTIIQADKASAELAGLYKTDLLSLRALDVVADCLEQIGRETGRPMGLSDVPADDPAVFDMIGDGMNVGIFQIESRAQIGISGLMRARSLHDLAVQIALIRPGPGAAGASRRYLERRAGREPVPAVHPGFDAIVAKTRGVVLYQEQVMQVAIDLAGFDPVAADSLRRAMSAKNAEAAFEKLRERFAAGLAGRGITGAVAEEIWGQIAGFSGYSFPESHALSFAYIALANAWIKKYHPAMMLASMLNRQPMGFYDPTTLIEDARRNGVTVRPVDVQVSEADAALEPLTEQEAVGYRMAHRHASPFPQPPVRLGLAAVRDVGAERAARIVEARAAEGAFRDAGDLARRTALPLAALEALTAAGALDGFGMSRRETLWVVGAAAGSHPGHLPGSAPAGRAPQLAEMTVEERTFEELWAGQTSQVHPMTPMRKDLAAVGVTAAADLPGLRHGRPVRVAGLVTHRQRPPTANGTLFLSISDETGLVNVIVPGPIWDGLPRRTQTAGALLIYGALQTDRETIDIQAGRISPLVVRGARDRSRSYR